MYLEEQNNLLYEVQCVFGKMRCVGKRGLQVFQEGVLMTTRALPKLFDLVNKKYSVKYIMTHKLNQDIVENLFFRIRSRGGLYDHPSPLTVLHRLRHIILSTDPGIVSRNTNVNENVGDGDVKEEFMTVQAFRKAKIVVHDAEENKENIVEEEENIIRIEDDVSFSRNPMMEIEEDGLRYLAGYIIRKHSKTTPHILKFRAGIQEHNYQKPSWVNHLSYGGLIDPCDTLVTKLKFAENFFLKFVGNGIPKGKHIVKNTSSQVCAAMNQDEIQLDESIIQTYVRLRIFIRMKFLTRKGSLFESKRKKKPKLDNNAKLKKICI
jgi:hypothetical protein